MFTLLAIRATARSAMQDDPQWAGTIVFTEEQYNEICINSEGLLTHWWGDAPYNADYICFCDDRYDNDNNRPTRRLAPPVETRFRCTEKAHCITAFGEFNSCDGNCVPNGRHNPDDDTWYYGCEGAMVPPRPTSSSTSEPSEGGSNMILLVAVIGGALLIVGVVAQFLLRRHLKNKAANQSMMLNNQPVVGVNPKIWDANPRIWDAKNNNRRKKKTPEVLASPGTVAFPMVIGRFG